MYHGRVSFASRKPVTPKPIIVPKSTASGSVTVFISFHVVSRDVAYCTDAVQYLSADVFYFASKLILHFWFSYHGIFAISSGVGFRTQQRHVSP